MCVVTSLSVASYTIAVPKSVMAAEVLTKEQQDNLKTQVETTFQNAISRKFKDLFDQEIDAGTTDAQTIRTALYATARALTEADTAYKSAMSLYNGADFQLTDRSTQQDAFKNFIDVLAVYYKLNDATNRDSLDTFFPGITALNAAEKIKEVTAKLTANQNAIKVTTNALEGLVTRVKASGATEQEGNNFRTYYSNTVLKASNLDPSNDKNLYPLVNKMVTEAAVYFAARKSFNEYYAYAEARSSTFDSMRASNRVLAENWLNRAKKYDSNALVLRWDPLLPSTVILNNATVDQISVNNLSIYSELIALNNEWTTSVKAAFDSVGTSEPTEITKEEFPYLTDAQISYVNQKQKDYYNSNDGAGISYIRSQAEELNTQQGTVKAYLDLRRGLMGDLGLYLAYAPQNTFNEAYKALEDTLNGATEVTKEYQAKLTADEAALKAAFENAVNAYKTAMIIRITSGDGYYYSEKQQELLKRQINAVESEKYNSIKVEIIEKEINQNVGKAQAILNTQYFLRNKIQQSIPYVYADETAKKNYDAVLEEINSYFQSVENIDTNALAKTRELSEKYNTVVQALNGKSPKQDQLNDVFDRAILFRATTKFIEATASQQARFDLALNSANSVKNFRFPTEGDIDTVTQELENAREAIEQNPDGDPGGRTKTAIIIALVAFFAALAAVGIILGNSNS